MEQASLLLQKDIKSHCTVTELKIGLKRAIIRRTLKLVTCSTYGTHVSMTAEHKVLVHFNMKNQVIIFILSECRSCSCRTTFHSLAIFLDVDFGLSCPFHLQMLLCYFQAPQSNKFERTGRRSQGSK